MFEAVRLWRTSSAATEITKDLYVKKIDQSENLLYLLIYELLKGSRVYYIIGIKARLTDEFNL